MKAPGISQRLTSARRGVAAFSDKAHFLKILIGSPRLTGAVSPSGRRLAQAMAHAVGPPRDGLVIELGPGTGPVTKALLESGIAPADLLLVEFDGGFCSLLAARFPGVRIVQGDAYALRKTLAELINRPVRAIVSSLPLLNQKREIRSSLFAEAFALMQPDGVFVQFTYGLGSPIPASDCAGGIAAQASAPIWRNLPPARVWTYRASSSAVAPRTMIARLRRKASLPDRPKHA
jgi:phosphatidylethanolamine/phosphatidyl-N-methylethanolamine N-methyltransferase